EHDSEGKELTPSRFIIEIPEVHLKKARKTIETDISRGGPVHLSLLEDKEYLNTLFMERGFPVTHLNNFLKCPWQYFFLNLLQMPKAQENPQLYGSAVHGALRDYFEAYKREEDITVDQAVDLFEKYLRRTHMTERDLKDYIKSGREELKAYLTQYQFPRAIWNEFKVTGVPFAVDGKEIMLNGNLDKVELVGSGQVNVVDYKTGKPQSRNKLEGKTKDANGDYKRQLVFYKLILDRYKSGEWRMETGTLDFIKPDDYGKLHREVFVIGETEVQELETVIRDVAHNITALDCEGCGECEWCALEKHIRNS